MKIQSYFNDEGYAAGKPWESSDHMIRFAIKGYFNYHDGVYDWSDAGWKWLRNKKPADGFTKVGEDKVVFYHRYQRYHRKRVFVKGGRAARVPGYSPDYNSPLEVRQLWKILKGKKKRPQSAYQRSPQEKALTRLVDIGAVTITGGDIRLIPQYAEKNLKKAISSVYAKRREFLEQVHSSFKWELDDLCFSKEVDRPKLPSGQLKYVTFLVSKDENAICTVIFRHDKLDDGGLKIALAHCPSELHISDEGKWMTSVIKYNIRNIGARLHKELPPDITLLFTEALLGGFACLRPLCEPPKSLPSAGLVALNAPVFKMVGDA
jgi:hypothetical protein